MKPNLIDNPRKPIRTIRYATLLMPLVDGPNSLWIFVRLFSTMCFQTVPQKVCTRRCKVTYLSGRMHSHTGCICLAFLHCV